MGYDDSYDESKGDYWSLASMTTGEKTFYLLWNAWILLNFIALILIVRKLYKRWTNTAHNSG